MTRTITPSHIEKTVSGLAIEANLLLRKDVLRGLEVCLRLETNKRAKDILRAIIDNAAVARKEKLAICQDTGMPVVFVQLGSEVKITGDLNSAINKGIESGYKKGYLRSSVVHDPIKRGPSKYGPAVIHVEIIRGNKLKITVLPKGFGCENKSALKMFRPTQGIEDIKRFIVESVKNAGPDACPPYVVGVGIGGTADYACLLAKKALLKQIASPVRKLETQVLNEINKLGIGPMGLGGKTTAIAVNIETYPTHIAGLPVAVNISCHALRSACKTL
jgi:fumarate hydratase subunit alpha